jgi:hypothetical protein
MKTIIYKSFAIVEFKKAGKPSKFDVFNSKGKLSRICKSEQAAKWRITRALNTAKP